MTTHAVARTVTTLEQSACKRIYQVVENGVPTPFQIELSMVCDGTPCLYLKHQHSYTAWSKTFPIVTCYTRPYWNEAGGRYIHQFNQEPIQGPKVEEVIPLGFLNFWEFFEQSVVCFQMCTLRYRALPLELPAYSKAVLDPESRSRVHLELSAGYGSPFRLPSLSVQSSSMSGSGQHCPREMKLFPVWWQQWLDILPKEWLTWDQLSAEQFNDICAHMRNVRKSMLKGK